MRHDELIERLDTLVRHKMRIQSNALATLLTPDADAKPIVDALRKTDAEIERLEKLLGIHWSQHQNPK